MNIYNIMNFLFLLIGLIVGSFLNVIIWRYPIIIQQQMGMYNNIIKEEKNISLVWPRSYCPHCGHSIRARDNIPVLSWFLLKGRCRDCHTSINWRYPLVESITAISFLLANIVWPVSVWGGAVMVLSAWLIVACFIDIEHQWLPDVFTQGVLWTGLIIAWSQQGVLSLSDAITGIIAGFIFFYILRVTSCIILQKEALGMGDVLLFAGLGGWTGIVQLPIVALIASGFGLLYVLSTKKYSCKLPFGPFLGGGGILTLYIQELF